MSEWLVPFQGRNYSGEYTQNFLWKKENIYIMDNHRAALWCWFQHIAHQETFNVFHIDQHTDTLYSNIDKWIELCPELDGITLNDYLEISYEADDIFTLPLFRWDNYLSIFLEKYKAKIGRCYFATHQEGDKPRHNSLQDVSPWELPNNFENWVSRLNNPCIVNIDIDYFVYTKSTNDIFEFFSDKYFNDLFLAVRKSIDAGKVSVCTISLSPECCGGWPLAEELCYKACEILGVDFKLPES